MNLPQRKSKPAIATLALALLALAAMSAASCGSDTNGTSNTSAAGAGGPATLPPASSTGATIGVSTTATSPAGSSAAVNPAPSSQTISIRGYTFTPAAVTVPRGTTIQWTNGDTVPHTVAADGGQFSSGNIGVGQSFSFTFDQPGTYAYHCGLHPAMTGTVTVN